MIVTLTAITAAVAITTFRARAGIAIIPSIARGGTGPGVSVITGVIIVGSWVWTVGTAIRIVMRGGRGVWAIRIGRPARATGTPQFAVDIVQTTI